MLPMRLGPWANSTTNWKQHWGNLTETWPLRIFCWPFKMPQFMESGVLGHVVFSSQPLIWISGSEIKPKNGNHSPKFFLESFCVFLYHARINLEAKDGGNLFHKSPAWRRGIVGDIQMLQRNEMYRLSKQSDTLRMNSSFTLSQEARQACFSKNNQNFGRWFFPNCKKHWIFQCFPTKPSYTLCVGKEILQL